MMNESTSFGAAATRTLLDRLQAEPDEVLVFSFAARATGGVADLSFASVLIGPPELASQSWPCWAANAGVATSANQLDRWAASGIDANAWTTFTEERDGWIFGRQIISMAGGLDAAIDWITDLIGGLPVEIPGSHGQQVHAGVRAAGGIIRTSPFATSPAQLLITAVHRPTLGYFFPSTHHFSAVDAPAIWNVNGSHVFNAPLLILGLPIAEPPLRSRPFDVESGPVGGIYVGRIERRAWIAGLRAEPGAQTYRITLGLDERRINLADLVVDFEEFYEGELIGARRLQLNDVPLPQLPVPAGEQIVVEMPSVGSSLSREVRLYDRDGLLLDRTDRLPTLERIDISVQIGDAPPAVSSIGGIPPTALLERLAFADEADRQYERLLQAGLASRIIDDPSKGLPVLTARLGQVHGNLSVLDAYFGWDVLDWSVLDQVTGSIRVLTGLGSFSNGSLRQKKVVPPPVGTALTSASLSVRSWQGGTPPWHDRVYLWTGGGLSVGTSPSGLGKRIARLDRLSGNEALGWQALFDSWWASNNVGSI